MIKYPDKTIFVYYTTEQVTFFSKTTTIKRVTRIQYPNQPTDAPVVFPIGGPRNPGPVMTPSVRPPPPPATRSTVAVPRTVAPTRSRMGWVFWVLVAIAVILLLVIAFFLIRTYM
jgi:hypothetical protein